MKMYFQLLFALVGTAALLHLGKISLSSSASDHTLCSSSIVDEASGQLMLKTPNDVRINLSNIEIPQNVSIKTTLSESTETITFAYAETTLLLKETTETSEAIKAQVTNYTESSTTKLTTPKPTEQPTCVLSPPNSLLCNDVGVITPDKNNCNCFYSCDEMRRPCHQCCPSAYDFSLTLNTCVRGKEITCSRGFRCPVGNGTFHVMDKCSTFWHCANWIPYEKNCTPGHYFLEDPRGKLL